LEIAEVRERRRYNRRVLWPEFRWLVHLSEALVAIGLILAIGAAIAVTAFWLLHRTVYKLAGPPPETQTAEYDLEPAATASALKARDGDDSPSEQP